MPVYVLTEIDSNIRADERLLAIFDGKKVVHPIRRSNCAESGYCELIRPRKGLTSNNEVGKTAKAQSLPQNAPILKEFFGPMWLVRVKFQNNFRRCRCIELQILLYR